MTKKIVFTLFFWIAVLVIGGQELDAKEIVRDDYGISIDIPDRWDIKDGATASAIIKAVHRDVQNQLIMLTINVVPYDAVENKASYLNSSAEALGKALSAAYKAPLISAKETIIGNQKAFQIVIDAHLENYFHRIIEFYLIPQDRNTLNLSFSVDQEIYLSMRGTIDRILDSLKVS